MRKPKVEPLNLADPTLAATELADREAYFTLRPEYHPELADFRFPWPISPAVVKRRRAVNKGVKRTLKK